jgi:hypothetical protein
MSEGIPKKPDYIVWEAVRKSPEYQEYLLNFLRNKLEDWCLPKKTSERLHLSIPVARDLDSEDWLAEVMERDIKLTKKEQGILKEIDGLKTIEAILEYCRSKSIDIEKVERAIKEAEKFYAAYQKLGAIADEDYKKITGEEPEKSN